MEGTDIFVSSLLVVILDGYEIDHFPDALPIVNLDFCIELLSRDPEELLMREGISTYDALIGYVIWHDFCFCTEKVLSTDRLSVEHIGLFLFFWGDKPETVPDSSWYNSSLRSSRNLSFIQLLQ